jgi:transcriptional regulator with XRE-family HTH domain
MVPVLVEFRGVPYRLDLERCRRAMAELEIEGEVTSLRSLARSIGVSTSTVSRFFSGRLPSMSVTLKILDKLNLTFDQVASRDDDQGGSAGAGARSR